MSSYGRYQRARRQQDPAYQAWARRETRDVLIAVGVIMAAFVAVFSLVAVTTW